MQDTINYYAFTLKENIYIGDLVKGIPTDSDIEKVLGLVNSIDLIKK